jgi:hypothetical protein
MRIVPRIPLKRPPDDGLPTIVLVLTCIAASICMALLSGSATTGAASLVASLLFFGAIYSVAAWLMAWPRLRWHAVIDFITTPTVPSSPPPDAGSHR